MQLAFWLVTATVLITGMRLVTMRHTEVRPHETTAGQIGG
jgi:hypothetical protein